MQRVQHIFFSFFQPVAKWRGLQKERFTFASNGRAGVTCKMKPNNFLKLLDPKKKCMQKDPSGAQFGAEKIAREKKHLEHDLEHKKLHAKKPSGAQFEARKVAREKVAREKAHPEHDLKHKKRHAKTSLWSMIWRRKSCTKKTIWSMVWSTKSCTRKEPIRSTIWQSDLKHKKLKKHGAIFSAKWSCVLYNFERFEWNLKDLNGI